MVEFKLTINDVKTGKSYKKLVSGSDAEIFKGTKIKDIIKADPLGLKGYELQITGGSDNCGFPMHFSIHSTGRKRALLTKGPGVKIKKKGMKKRKTVVGNILSTNISQINLKITKYGIKKLDEIFGKKEVKEEKKEEKK